MSTVGWLSGRRPMVASLQECSHCALGTVPGGGGLSGTMGTFPGLWHHLAKLAASWGFHGPFCTGPVVHLNLAIALCCFFSPVVSIWMGGQPLQGRRVSPAVFGFPCSPGHGDDIEHCLHFLGERPYKVANGRN